MQSPRVIRPAVRVAGAVLALAMVAGSCGADDGEAGTSATSAGEREAELRSEDFVGLSEDEAIELAEGDGRSWRISRDGDQDFVITDDLEARRVTFEIDDGVVTAASIEVAPADPAPDVSSEDDAQARLQADAIVRLVTVDHGFAAGSAPFEQILVANLVGGRATQPVEPLALEIVSDELSAQAQVEFVIDADAAIEEHFAQSAGVAVAVIDGVRIDGERAELDMRLWCGSLCGVFLSYEAVRGPAGWEITGTIGPIAMS